MNDSSALLQIITLQDERITGLEDELDKMQRLLDAAVCSMNARLARIERENMINTDDIEHLKQYAARRSDLGRQIRLPRFGGSYDSDE